MKNIRLAAVAVLGLIILFLLNTVFLKLKQEQSHAKLSNEADLVQFRLSNALAMRVDSTRYLEALLLLHPDTTASEFEQFAQSLMKTIPPLRALQFADENTQVVFVYPAATNEITITNPMILLDDPLRREYVKKAIEERISTIQPPFELRQGGLGIIVRSPLYVSDTFSGLAIAVLDVPAIIEEAITLEESSFFQFSLTDADGHTFYNKLSANTPVVERVVSFADAEWTLKIAYANNGGAHFATDSFLVFGLGGLALFLLLALLWYLGNRTEHLQRVVAERTRNLQITAKEKDFLMTELNHRIKNNLMMINSLIRLRSNSPGERVDLSDIIHQIDVIRIVHEKLYQTATTTHLDFRNYVLELLSAVFSFSGRQVQVDTNIEVGEISTKTIIPLGLLINEVATNAIKYGFKPQEPAVFTVSIHLDADNYILTLADNGNQFPEAVDFENTDTLGLRLIKVLALQLEGTVELLKRPETLFTIRFPVAQ